MRDTKMVNAFNIDSDGDRPASSHGVLLAACIAVAVLFAPFSIEISVGQDAVGVSISNRLTVAPPESGSAPKPNASEPASQEPLAVATAVAQQPLPPQVANPPSLVQNRPPNLEAEEEPAAEVAEEAGLSEVTSDTDMGFVEEDQTLATANAGAGDLPNQKKDNAEPVELSVEPGTLPLLPQDRPKWVGAEPDLSGSVHRIYVGSTAVSRKAEVEEALDIPLLAATHAYVDGHVLMTPFASESLPIDTAYIRRNLINEPQGTIIELNTSQGPMYQKWVTLEVTPEQRAQMKAWQVEAIQRRRIAPIGIGLGAMLGLVGLTHLVLRRKHISPSATPLDPATLNAVSPDGAKFVANPAAAAGRHKSGSRSVLGTLLLIGCFILVPFALLIGLGLVMAGSRQVITTKSAIHEMQEVERLDAPIAPSAPSVPTSGESQDLQEYKIESNGQTIIIRNRD